MEGVTAGESLVEGATALQPTDFDLHELLGEGSFAKVYRADDKRTGKVVAVKLLNMQEDDGMLEKEITMMEKNQNDSIVQYYGHWVSGADMGIVMEYCGAGPVNELMRVEGRCVQLPEEIIKVICRHVLSALAWLHSNRKIHRDIKGCNILLTEDGRAKLADFGISTRISTMAGEQNTVIGTPFWMAPEVIGAEGSDNGYDFKADIWSLGITALEMAETRPPYADKHYIKAMTLIHQNDPPKLKHPRKWSGPFQDFLDKCLTKDPAQRSSAAELLEHPFITSAIEIALTDFIRKEWDNIVGRRHKVEKAEKYDDDECYLDGSDDESIARDQGDSTSVFHAGDDQGDSTSVFHAGDDQGDSTSVFHAGDDEGNGTSVFHAGDDDGPGTSVFHAGDDDGPGTSVFHAGDDDGPGTDGDGSDDEGCGPGCGTSVFHADDDGGSGTAIFSTKKSDDGTIIFKGEQHGTMQSEDQESVSESEDLEFMDSDARRMTEDIMANVERLDDNLLDDNCLNFDTGTAVFQNTLRDSKEKLKSDDSGTNTTKESKEKVKSDTKSGDKKREGGEKRSTKSGRKSESGRRRESGRHRRESGVSDLHERSDTASVDTANAESSGSDIESVPGEKAARRKEGGRRKAKPRPSDGADHDETKSKPDKTRRKKKRNSIVTGPDEESQDFTTWSVDDLELEVLRIEVQREAELKKVNQRFDDKKTHLDQAIQIKRLEDAENKK